ncbi:hypothetical protein D3C71_2039170 [compost metagenome]
MMTRIDDCNSGCKRVLSGMEIHIARYQHVSTAELCLLPVAASGATKYGRLLDWSVQITYDAHMIYLQSRLHPVYEFF